MSEFEHRAYDAWRQDHPGDSTPWEDLPAFVQMAYLHHVTETFP